MSSLRVVCVSHYKKESKLIFHIHTYGDDKREPIIVQGPKRKATLLLKLLNIMGPTSITSLFDLKGIQHVVKCVELKAHLACFNHE